MKRAVFFSLILLTISSCNWIMGIIDLGSGYYYEIDDIVLSTTNSYDGVGFCVIPPTILAFNKTEEFIIATSLNKRNEERFWLILKNQNRKELDFITESDEFDGYYVYSNIIGPMDEAEFKIVRTKYKVPLDLELKKVE